MKAQHTIPIKKLIKVSGRLFVLFLLGTILLTSLQELSFKNVVQRAVSLGSLFLFVFSINTILIHYFDIQRKSIEDRIWKQTFITGYFFNLVFFFVHYLVVEWLDKQGYTNIHQEPIAGLNGWRLIVFLMYSTLIIHAFIFLIQNYVLNQFEQSKIQMELLELKAAISEAVNQLLQQQIQPHFLFNALNILKSLIRKNPKRAEEYLLHLSDFLRLSISKNSSGVATVADELKICRDYMEMQHIRFGSAIRFQIDIENTDEVLQQKIPFFSLQPLLENAIKHNELTIENPLYIKIEHQGQYIIVSNNLQLKSILEASSGNGHSMLKERYNILNDDSPIFKTEGQIYSVSLKILKSEYSNRRR